MEILQQIESLSGLNGLLLLLAMMVVLYVGRDPAKRAIESAARLLANTFRFLASSTSRTEAYLQRRNRTVLLAAGREAKERIIEREFERIGDTVHRDLSRYPELQRTLAERIHRIDDDHQATAEVPPDVPGWTKVVDAVAKVPAKADPSIRDVLVAIQSSLERAHSSTLEEYRKASGKRHRLLSKMMPQWRNIQSTLDDMRKTVDSLNERSRSIDRHMNEYRDIVQGQDRAVHLLSTSAWVSFVVSALVIAIAVGGAFINFSLIARPMSEMVGGTSYVGSFQTADIAALVIILVELSMGLFLMESLRITRLFPVIGALPDRIRTRMVWVTLTILTALATVEAGLAFMREMLLQDELATMATLRGSQTVVTSETAWITTSAQMGMGFVLPFALTLAAVPLEALVHATRHVAGALIALMLRAAAVVFRAIAQMLLQLGTLLCQIYDMLIFGLLWLETKLVNARDNSRDKKTRLESEQPQGISYE